MRLTVISFIFLCCCCCEAKVEDGAGRFGILGDEFKRLSSKIPAFNDQESLSKSPILDYYSDDSDDLLGALKTTEKKSDKKAKKKHKRPKKNKKGGKRNVKDKPLKEEIDITSKDLNNDLKINQPDNQSNLDLESNEKEREKGTLAESNAIEEKGRIVVEDQKEDSDSNKQIVLFHKSQEDNDEEEEEDEKEDVNQEIIDRLEILRMEIETLKRQSAQHKFEDLDVETSKLPPTTQPATQNTETNVNDSDLNEDKTMTESPSMKKVLSERDHQLENRKKWIPKAKAEEVERNDLEQQQRGWYLVMGVSVTALFIAIGVSYFVIRAYW